VNGPAHYAQAERLLEHAAAMLDTDVAPEDRAELVGRHAAVAQMATALALLAAATAIGLSAHLDSADTNAWRDVAAARLTDPGVWHRRLVVPRPKVHDLGPIQQRPASHATSAARAGRRWRRGSRNSGSYAADLPRATLPKTPRMPGWTQRRCSGWQASTARFSARPSARATRSARLGSPAE
jgi:hypothetical protein